MKKSLMEKKGRSSKDIDKLISKIVWSLASMAISLWVFWFICGYLMGHNIWTKQQAQKAMILSGLTAIIIGLAVGVKLEALKQERKKIDDELNDSNER